MHHSHDDRSSRRRPRRLVLSALLGAGALVLAGCGGNAGEGEDGGPVTLRLSTFGTSTSLEALIPAFEEANPGVTVEVNTVASEADARTSMFTKLAAGSGLADVEQTEVAWMGEMSQFSDRFVAFEDDGQGAWVDFQEDPARTEDGQLFGYGIGAGPEAICYRADLLEAAGMASDPESVAAMVGGTWDEYFAAGEAYKAGGGQGGWFDGASFIYSAQVEQLAAPYETEDGEIVVDNPELEAIFKDTLAVAPELSAKLPSFSEDWNAGMASGAFATMMCPSWILEVIAGNAPDVTTWRIANAFPGGGGNLGGSYFVVPTQSEHPEEAAALATYLTAPEQQVAAFKTGSAFPTRVEALDAPDLLGVTNPYFGDAPVGEIFAERSSAITEVIYKGPNYPAISVAADEAITRAETGQQSIDDAWEAFVAEAEGLQ